MFQWKISKYLIGSFTVLATCIATVAHSAPLVKPRSGIVFQKVTSVGFVGTQVRIEGDTKAGHTSVTLLNYEGIPPQAFQDNCLKLALYANATNSPFTFTTEPGCYLGEIPVQPVNSNLGKATPPTE